AGVGERRGENHERAAHRLPACRLRSVQTRRQRRRGKGAQAFPASEISHGAYLTRRLLLARVIPRAAPPSDRPWRRAVREPSTQTTPPASATAARRRTPTGRRDRARGGA